MTYYRVIVKDRCIAKQTGNWIITSDDFYICVIEDEQIGVIDGLALIFPNSGFIINKDQWISVQTCDTYDEAYIGI